LQQNEHSVGSLETAERENRSKRWELKLLGDALDDMEKTYKEVLEVKQNTSPYQECSDFDRKYKVSLAPKDPEPDLDLKELSDGVRQWMARLKKPNFTLLREWKFFI
jgi:hypothetical protein